MLRMSQARKINYVLETWGLESLAIRWTSLPFPPIRMVFPSLQGGKEAWVLSVVMGPIVQSCPPNETLVKYLDSGACCGFLVCEHINVPGGLWALIP